MNLTTIVLAAGMSLWLAGAGLAQSPRGSAGTRQDAITQSRSGDAANRGAKQRQPRRSDRAEPQSSDVPMDPEDERLTRILNICRGC
jgi:hypothetical protein